MDWYAMTNDSIEKKIGARLKQLRLQYNMSQSKLATLTGLSRVAISKIERGMGVNLSSLIEIMRSLRILENFENLIPEPQLSPIQLIERKNKSKRQRASPNRK